MSMHPIRFTWLPIRHAEQTQQNEDDENDGAGPSQERGERHAPHSSIYSKKEGRLGVVCLHKSENKMRLRRGLWLNA